MNCVAKYLPRTLFFYSIKYWIELKAKTKCKAADSRRSAAAIGGGPNKIIPLNEHEQCLLAIIGRVAVDGFPGLCC